MIKYINELLKKLLPEEYLDIEQQMVEIGVLTYLSQAGRLNTNREKRLRQLIESATGEISDRLAFWLVSHGLTDLAEDISNNVQDKIDEFAEIFPLQGYLSSIHPLQYGETDVPKLANELSNVLGGYSYFGIEAVSQEDLERFIEDHTEEEAIASEEDGEDDEVDYYFDGDEDDLIEFLLSCKKEQVETNDDFMELANELENSVENLKNNIDFWDIGRLVVEFDHLKDLNHANGNFLKDYVDIDFEDVNDAVESRVSELRKKGEV